MCPTIPRIKTKSSLGITANEQVLPMVGKFITSSPGLLKLNIYSNVKI